MMTRELLKNEIDKVRDEYLMVLFKIIKSLEYSQEEEKNWAAAQEAEKNEVEWHRFIDSFAGSLADSPISRGSQGHFEEREAIL